jgi:hypothetical protein
MYYTHHSPADPCTEATPTRAAATFKLDLSRLYATLCHIPSSDQTTLLLYLLVHRNRHVKTYIMARSDIELLVRFQVVKYWRCFRFLEANPGEVNW